MKIIYHKKYIMPWYYIFILHLKYININTKIMKLVIFLLFICNLICCLSLGGFTINTNLIVNMHKLIIKSS